MKPKNLKECIGKSWMYHATVYKFHSFSEKNGRITLATDGRWITFDRRNLGDFLQEILPVDDSEKSVAKTESQAQLQASEMRKNVTDLAAILKDNISRVKNNPEYVKQAKEVTNAARSIIDLARLEFEVLKEVKKNK